MNKSILLILVSAISFFSFSKKNDDDGLAKQQKLLGLVGSMMEQHHYLNPVIDDAFSKEIWKGYLNSLDAKKNILLQTDVDGLKKYEKYLDNEIHGEPVKFFPEAEGIYAKRCAEVLDIYRQILAQPFTFGKNDLIELNQKPKDFPRDNAERISRWKNSLKYLTLQKLIELQDLRVLSKPGEATYHKTDVQLEQEARESILKQNNRIFNRFRSFGQDRLFSAYLNVIARYIDPHSDYFAPQEKKSFDEKMGNRFFGIGIQLAEVDGVIKMMALTPGSPAYKSGAFTVNDQLTRLGQGENGPMTDVTGMELDDVVKLIRGEKGTVIRIGYKKTDGTSQVIPLVREEIKQDEALARSAVIREKGKNIGYIYLPMFYDDFSNAKGSHCAADVAAEISKLKAAHVDGLVMDLRYNGGGSLAEVIKMIGFFVGQGPAVQTMDGKGVLEVFRTNSTQPLYDGPLTVLVNEFSASASEIFAGAIQDYHRGVIIGTATFGKGTVQTTVPLGAEEYGALKLTIKKFYRVNGGSTQQKGVIPDVVLPDSRETGKVHEGDQPFALNWDKISRTDYAQWNTNVDSLEALAEVRLGKDHAFAAIRDNNTWLEEHPDTVQRMTVMQYRTELMTRRKIGKQNELLQQLGAKEIMDVEPVSVTDKEKEKAYKEWLKKISGDIYIRQALKVNLDMI
ncbi:MAG TPA: carboxy terminal-processing peptidase [Pedobacter sp.]